MAEKKTILRPTETPGLYLADDGGNEPAFTRTVGRGEMQYVHQSGYGYLPESRIEIVAAGVRVVGHACKLDGSICESRPDRCSDCPAGDKP